MKPEYRMELRLYDKETGDTIDCEDTYVSVYDNGTSSFEMAGVCLGSLERRFPKAHAQHLADYYQQPDVDEEE